MSVLFLSFFLLIPFFLSFSLLIPFFLTFVLSPTYDRCFPLHLSPTYDRCFPLHLSPTYDRCFPLHLSPTYDLCLTFHDLQPADGCSCRNTQALARTKNYFRWTTMQRLENADLLRLRRASWQVTDTGSASHVIARKYKKVNR